MNTVKAKEMPRLPILSGLIATALVLLFLLWDWNWFRPIIERKASQAIGREVRIGHLDVALSWHPTVRLLSVTVANPKDFTGKQPLLTGKDLSLTIDLAQLWRSRTLLLEQVSLTGFDGALYRDPKGRANWRLQLAASDPDPSFATVVQTLRVVDSGLRFSDPSLAAELQAEVKTVAGKSGEAGYLRADFSGRYQQAPLTGYFIGGDVLGLRAASKPYPVEAKLVNGRTQVQASGSIRDPLRLGGVNVQATIRGQNLADLYALTGLPMPESPPYAFKSRVDYQQGRILLQGLRGTVGSSDLAGDLVLDLTQAVKDLSGRLRSKSVHLPDLAGFIGARKAAEDAAANSEKLIPNFPINLPKLRAANIRLKYQADRIRGENMPVDELSADVALVDGRYQLKPLQFKVGAGQIKVNLLLDGSSTVPTLDAKAEFQRVDASRFLEAVQVKGAGTIAGRIAVKSSGSDAAAMMARGNGELQLFGEGGNLSALLVNLAGIDLGNSLFALLGIPRRTDIRCMIADFELRDGVMHSKTGLVDTELANLKVDGKVDFRDESLQLRLTTEPKRLNVASLAAPIGIRGSLKDPSIKPDYATIGIKVGIAAVVGAVVSPLAALLPTLQLGLGEDSQCAQLIKDAKLEAKTPVVAPKTVRQKSRRSR